MHTASLFSHSKLIGNARLLKCRTLSEVRADRMGFFLLIALLSLVPFHQNVMGVFIYYKEVIAVLFLI